MKNCLFCKIAAKEIPCHKVWESKTHLAFLTIFPNTPGFTVVIPKKHFSSYAFDLQDSELTKLVLAAKKVSKLIDRNLPGVGRTGLIFEGFGVDHVHAKLFPMHGTSKLAKWKPILSNQKKFFRKYEGYISTHDCKRAPDNQLNKIASLIIGKKHKAK